MLRVILIIILALSCHESFANNVEIKVGMYELAPHMMIKNGKLTGSVVEYVQNEVVPQLIEGQKIKYVFSPFARIVDDVKNNRIDVVFMISKNEERIKFIEYPSEVLFKTTSALILKKGFFDKPLTRSDQIDHLLIGHTRGSVLPNFISRSKAKIEWVAGENALLRNLEKLKIKRLDAVFAPTYSHAQYLISTNKMENDFDIFVVPDTTLNLYFAFRKNLSPEIKKLFTKNKGASQKYMKYLKLILY